MDEEGRTRELPAHLSQTGLFADLPGDRLAKGVFTYSPEFVLWSDGAEKRRFIALPEGSHIDTSDAETWEFPEGTKLWKEFSRDERHLETRLLQKTGPGAGDWAAAAYIWRADQADADLAPYGALDVLGTKHDVPASGECFGCHSGRSNRILGFSAVQLSPRSYEESEQLSGAAERALLAEPMPTLDIPGTATERDALGYLHANCSHCHNQSDSARGDGKCFNPNQRLSFDLDFTLHVGELDSVEETAAYRTALGKVVDRGNPGASKVVQLMSKRDGGLAQMPPLGTETVDDHGLDLIRAWVRAL
jgi:hypothetical protein